MKCPKCSHEWTYKGKSLLYVTCPNCYRKIHADPSPGSIVQPTTTQLISLEEIEAPPIEIKIDPEISKLLLEMREKESDDLKESILTEGCRDPLVVWKDHNTLLDGHRRYSICKESGRPFKISELSFPDKKHAMLWVLKNQISRRNLTKQFYNIYSGKAYLLEKELKK